MLCTCDVQSGQHLHSGNNMKIISVLHGKGVHAKVRNQCRKYCRCSVYAQDVRTLESKATLHVTTMVRC